MSETPWDEHPSGPPTDPGSPAPPNGSPLADAQDGGAGSRGGGLQRRVVSGVAWTASARVLGLVVQTASTIVLARLISPADFGLFAIALVFFGYGNLVGNLGLGTALVQRPVLNAHHLATAFWLNFLLGLLLALALMGASMPIAVWFAQPDLAGVLVLVSLTYVLQFSVVPLAVLERQMRFRAVVLVEASASLVGLATAVYGAFSGWGVVALASQMLVQTSIISILSTAAARWLPRSRPTFEALRDLWSVSGWLTAGNLIGYWSMNVDTLALGARVSPTELGYYNRAYNLLLLPLRNLGGVLTRVLLPALASIQEDTDRLRVAWIKSARMMALASFPICIGMAASAPALVATLWGSTWSAVAPLLQLLALAGVPWSMAVAAEWLLFARGRARVFFTLAVVNTTLTLLAVAIGLGWGTTGVAVAILIRSLLIAPLYFWSCLSDVGVSVWAASRAVAPLLAISLVMGLVVMVLGAVMTPLPAALTLGVQVVVGVGIFAGLLHAVAPDLPRTLKIALRDK